MAVAGFDTWLSLVPCLPLLMNDIYNHLYKITSHNLLVCTFLISIEMTIHLDSFNYGLMYGTFPLDPF